MIVTVQDNWVLRAFRLDDQLLELDPRHLGKVQVEGVCPCGQEVFLLIMLRDFQRTEMFLNNEKDHSEPLRNAQPSCLFLHGLWKREKVWNILATLSKMSSFQTVNRWRLPTLYRRLFPVTEGFRKPTLFEAAAAETEAMKAIFWRFRFYAASDMIHWIDGAWYVVPLLRFWFYWMSLTRRNTYVICSESDVIQISTFVLSVQKWKNSEEYVSLTKRTHSVRQQLWHPVQDSFMLSCLMGASWTRHITKEIFYVCRLRHSETGYSSERQFWCVSKFMNLSSRIGGKYLHATPRKRNSSIFSALVEPLFDSYLECETWLFVPGNSCSPNFMQKWFKCDDS